MEVVSESKARLFKGRVSSADAHDLVPGALQLAENVQFNTAGAMIGRRGLEARNPRVTADGDIIAMTRFDRPEAEWIVWETDEGKIKACKTSDYDTVTTLATGYNTFQPMCFAHDRYGRLYGANGIDRPWRWDGLTSSVEPMGMDAPDDAPTISSPTGGSLSAGDYLCAYRYLDDDLSFVDYYAQTSGTAVPSSLSSATSHTAAANDKLEWTGLSASAQARTAKVELWRTIAGESETYYRLTFTGVSTQTYIGHDGSITSSASSSGFVRFTLPSGHGLVVGARILVTGHSVSGYNTNHRVTAVTATTATTSVAYSSDGTGGTWQLNGYVNDTQSDADLILLTSMAVETSDGRHPIARRFTPPPDTKPFLTFFQDRLFFAGSIHYTTTVTTNGTTTLHSTGNAFTSTMVGRFVYIEGETVPYTIASFTDFNDVVLDRATVTSDSFLDCVIAPSPVERNQIWWSEIDEPEAVPTQNVLALQENTGDNDSITGLIAHGSDLLITKDRHIYALSYYVQPEIDASIVLRSRRGMLNHRSFALFEGALYLMDQAGVYTWNGGTPETISLPIQDVWRDTNVVFENRKDYFLHLDPAMEVVRAFIALVRDDTHVGSRWLEYALRDNQWSTGYTVFPIKAACLATRDGDNRYTYSVYGGPNDRLLTTKVPAVGSDREGSDYVNSETRGTLTGATSSTLTDSTASFTDAVLDAPVALLTGDGKHQISKITARTSTQLTVSPAFDTTPEEGDTYLIGAIEVLAKTGLYTLAEKRGEEYHKRAFRMVYLPLTNGTLDIRRYYDHATSPETSSYAQDVGTNLSWPAGSADGVVDIRTARSGLANAAGFVELKFGGRTGERTQADRWVAIEVRGMQGDQRIQLYEFTLQSVE